MVYANKMYVVAWGQMVVEAIGIAECWRVFFFILKSGFLKVMVPKEDCLISSDHMKFNFFPIDVFEEI